MSYENLEDTLPSYKSKWVKSGGDSTGHIYEINTKIHKAILVEVRSGEETVHRTRLLADAWLPRAGVTSPVLRWRLSGVHTTHGTPGADLLLHQNLHFALLGDLARGQRLMSLSAFQALKRVPSEQQHHFPGYQGCRGPSRSLFPTPASTNIKTESQ